MAGKKVQVCITVDEELMGWIEEKIETRDFHNKSHAFELGIAKLRHMDVMRRGLLVSEDGSVALSGKKSN
jgi:Arc/MetJ-type ribon-helix-helix transcriptional regulator